MVQINSTYCNETPADAGLEFAAEENNQVRINFRKPMTVTGSNGFEVKLPTVLILLRKYLATSSLCLTTSVTSSLARLQQAS